jgi:hypothetical protein
LYLETGLKQVLFVTESATNPEVQGSMPAAGSSGSERLRAVREGSRTSSSQEKETTKKSTAALNTSYSSEELLFQAASSLQGLEGKKIQFESFWAVAMRTSIFAD